MKMFVRLVLLQENRQTEAEVEAATNRGSRKKKYDQTQLGRATVNGSPKFTTDHT